MQYTRRAQAARTVRLGTRCNWTSRFSVYMNKKRACMHVRYAVDVSECWLFGTNANTMRMTVLFAIVNDEIQSDCLYCMVCELLAISVKRVLLKIVTITCAPITR